MLIPYYVISEKVGCSGRSYSFKRWWRILTVGTHLKEECPNLTIQGMTSFRFNPYRDISYGGTTLGFKGKNYWIADDCLVGKLLKYIFRNK